VAWGDGDARGEEGEHFGLLLEEGWGCDGGVVGRNWLVRVKGRWVEDGWLIRASVVNSKTT